MNARSGKTPTLHLVRPLSLSLSLSLSLCEYICQAVSAIDVFISQIALPAARYESEHDDVVVTYRRFPLMNLFLTLNQSSEAIFYFDESKVEEVSAELGSDDQGTRFLRLRLRAAVGTLLGLIFRNDKKNNNNKRRDIVEETIPQGKDSSFRFSFYLSEESHHQEVTIAIPQVHI